MEDENWRKIRKTFDDALRRQPEERARFVSEVCGGDKTLLAEVESLLSSLDNAENFMETPAVAKVAGIIVTETKKLETGKCFGHYEIIEQIGAGGMGEIYLARDKKLDRKVAVKILNENFSRHESNLSRFTQEAKAASALNHPNILVIHEIGESEETHYIVSEYVKGKTLRERLRQSLLKLSEILDISIQIGSALSSAHEAYLVHRDIKPENIMIRPDGYVKVLDFGLAKLVEQKSKSILDLDEPLAERNPTEKGVIWGTVNYMSPEQAKGEQVDERTDIFSLGVVVYEMIAGRTPFQSDSRSETFANLIIAEPQPISRFADNLPKELERIVWKMIRKKKDERYQMMKDVVADLKNLRENLSIEEKLERSASSGDRTMRILQATTGEANLTTVVSKNTFFRQFGLQRRLAALALTGLFAGVIVFSGWFAIGNWATSESPVLSAPFALEKLSNSGKVSHAAISPDGKNVFYVNGSTNDKQSLWLRQIETGNNVEIIPPSDDFYFGLAPSDDGNFLYFARRPRRAEGQADIYRISVFGGVPQRIISETQGWMSVSKDGAKISFVRCYYREDENCSLWIADAPDGKNERLLTKRPRPFRITDNGISPDGKRIAFAAGQSKNGANEFGLLEVDIESGAEREITAEKFFLIQALVWLPDASGLLITAKKNNESVVKIQQVFYDSGKVTPLTRDAESYLTLSLNRDASRLVSTHLKMDFQLRISNLENPSESRLWGDTSNANFTPDGKILISSPISGNQDIWIVDADSGKRRQLTNDGADDFVAIASPDGGSIFFASNRTGSHQVWRMNADGSNQRQITQTEGGSPLVVSSDGKWLYYHHGINRTLWRVPTDGGQEQLFYNKAKNRFAFSPDGLLFAFAEKQGAGMVIAVASLVDRQIVKTLKISDPQAKIAEIAFLSNSQTLVYVLTDNAFRNGVLWLQAPKETPRRIVALGEDELSEGGGFALSPDGKTFAVIQGGWRHDAVLLKGLK